jgi:hypothetical protein
MASLRIWIILSWIAPPTVMFGGYSLLRLLNRGDALTPFQVDCFRLLGPGLGNPVLEEWCCDIPARWEIKG